MIRKSWLETCGRGASFVAFFIFTFAIIAPALSAQIALGGGVVKPVSPPAFVVAPSVPLGYSPTSIASGTLTSSGHTDLVTADFAAGKITVFAGQGHGTFAPGVAYAAGAQPTSLVIADVDGDGRADVVLANPSEGVISVFPGNGDGTLGARKTYAIGFTPSFVAVGDFTGSGRLDIAVAGATGRSLAILQNAGGGNLNRPLNLGLTSTPAAIVAADFNHDGHMDLAVAGTSGAVTVFLGKGNGQFSALPDVGVVSGGLSSIAVGDFNRDGNPDIVVTSSALNQAAVLIGHGDGNFASATLLSVGNSPVATHVADVDGDGIADLIVINRGSNTFSVLNGVGDGTFKSAANFVVGNAPLGAATADFYGNGRVDLATINQIGQNLSVPSANADGTFVAGRAYAAGLQPVAVAAGDLTKSGRSDMVVANYCASDATCGGGGSAAVLLAGPGGVYQLGSTYAMGTGSVGVHLIDVNGDGILDMVALNRVDKTVAIRLGAGDGTFGSLLTTALSASPVALASADFNKDGKIDLAVLGDCGSATCGQPGQVELLLGSGNGNFRSASTYAVGYSPTALAVGNTTTSGNADIVVANRCSDAACKSGGSATLLFGNGVGSFKSGTAVALGNSPASIALADLRGQGILDLVVSRSTDNTVAVLPGTGSGSFGTAVPYAVGHAPGTLAIADFNGDGKPDVAVANTADSTVSVLFGKAGGALQPAFAVPVAGNPSALTAIASKSGSASLATPSGSAGSPVASSNVTVVANLRAQPQLVGGPAPTTVVNWTAGSSSPSAVNQSVSFTATVTGTGGTPTSPTGGSVVFFSDGIAIADCNGLADSTSGIVVTAGTSPDSTAVCATSSLTFSAGGHLITAQYVGTNDLKYDSSAVSASISQVVNALTPTLTLTDSATANTSVVNQSVTFTATLAPPASGSFSPLPPTGSVAFTGGGITGCGTVAITTVGAPAGDYIATCTTTDLVLNTAGATITATYNSGDTNYNTVAKTATHTVDAQTPSLALAAVPSGASVVNQSVTFTATLSPAAVSSFSPVAPTGSVAFTGGGITGCGTVTITTVGAPAGDYIAQCVTSDLTPGTNVSITATYNPGNTNYNTTSGSMNHTVNKQTPAVAVGVVPAATSHLNQSVTITATLTPENLSSFSPVAPAGSVAFSTVAGAIGTCSSQAISGVGTAPFTSYTATCTTSALTVADSGAITATFNPTNTADYNTATGNSASHSITALTPNVAVTADHASPQPLNTSVTYTATLTPPTGDNFLSVAPVGTVSFSANSSPISTCSGANAVAITGVGTAPFASYTAQCPYAGLVFGSNTITATFTPTAGNTNYLTNTSSAFPFTINALTGSLAMSALPTGTVTVGTSVTYKATITLSPAGSFSPVPPSGTVAFSLNGVAIAACATQPLTSQAATCATSALVGPTDSITASYSTSDHNYSISDGQFTQNVSPATPTVAVTADNATVAVNQPVKFTAKVSPPAVAGAQTPPPTGTVTFNQGATTLCSLAGLDTSVSPPAATCTYTFSTTGTNLPVTAAYTSANLNNYVNVSAAASTPALETIAANPTTITVNSAGDNFVNTQVTFTATVKQTAFAGSTGTAVPAGHVTFATTGSTLPTDTCVAPTNQIPITVSGAGNAAIASASCSFTFSAAGTFNVTATFTPSDSNFSPSITAAPPYQQLIKPGSAAINLTPSKDPSAVNELVTFTAAFPTITGTQPAGKVTYNDGSTAIANCAGLTVTGGQIPQCATAFTTATTTTNVHSITAVFTPDPTSPFNAATSTAVTQQVTPDPTSIPTATFTQSPAPAAVNQTVTFTAHISLSNTAGGATPPTSESVTFNATNPSNVTAQLCTGPISVTPGSPAIVSASCTGSFNAKGSYTIWAVYNGDSNFTGSQSANQTFTVNSSTGANVSITPPSSVTVNTPVSFSATVTPTATNPGGTTTLPTGTITFTDSADSRVTCTTGQIIANAGNTAASGSCNLTFLSASSGSVSHSITATYNGDANFGSSSTGTSNNPVTVNVNKATPTINVFPDAASVTNQQITLTATFSLIAGTQPTGTVDFKAKRNNQTSTVCSGTLSTTTGTSGNVTSASCKTFLAPFLGAAGSYSLTATYNFDQNFVTVDSTNLATQTVNPAPAAVVVTSSSGGGNSVNSDLNAFVTFTATVTPQVPDGTLSTPTQTVNFFQNQTAITACQNVAVSPVIVGGTKTGSASATCTTQFTTKGTFGISASYNTGNADPNFLFVDQANSTPVTQNVGSPATAFTLVADSTTPTVNQPVKFTFRIAPTIPVPPNAPGITTPSGLITFSDPDTSTQICSPTPSLAGNSSDGSSTTSCTITFVKHGAHTITAQFKGDANFQAGQQTYAIQVGPSDTVVTLANSPAVFATQAVTYTATVKPLTYQGAKLAVPQGTITFTFSDPATILTACPTPVPVGLNGDGSSSAACTVTFPHEAAPSGSATVTATYTDLPTGNFTTNHNTDNTLTQSVQDFNVGLTVTPVNSSKTTSVSTPTAIYVTPGYGTVANGSVPVDPWGPATITSSYVVSSGYIAPDNINIGCQVFATRNPNFSKPLLDPSCSNLSNNSGPSQLFAVNVGANVPAGEYTVYFTTSDKRYNNTSLTLPQAVLLYVAAPVPALSLGAGSVGQQTLTFNTSLAAQTDSTGKITGYSDSITGIKCGQIFTIDQNNKVTGAFTNNNQLACGTQTLPQPVSGANTDIPVTFNTSPSTTTSTVILPNGSGSSTLYAAAVFGLPLMALLGWFGSKKSPRRTLYRFLSVLLLLFGVSYATGCGSSLNTHVTTTSPGIPQGNYLVQVTAAGKSGNTYYAVMELQVQPISK